MELILIQVIHQFVKLRFIVESFPTKTTNHSMLVLLHVLKNLYLKTPMLIPSKVWVKLDAVEMILLFNFYLEILMN